MQNPPYDDDYWISQALALAEHAEREGEVPVGAVLVAEGQLLATGWNQPISTQDPTAHAEIIALRQAAQKVKNYRLVDTTLYVTLEPCVMCVGALLHARVRRLVFGAFDLRAGAVASIFEILQETRLNHHVEWQGGVLKEECVALLKTFFKKRR